MFQKLLKINFKNAHFFKNTGFFQLETNEKGWCKSFTPYCELYVLRD